MRSYPEEDYEVEDLEELNADKWQINALKKNPNYIHWGNNEDYMNNNSEGWDASLEIEGVEDLWELDELNELIHFYFTVNRASKKCPDCNTGLNKETENIAKDYYDFENTGSKWCDKLTEDEIDALAKYRNITREQAKESFKDAIDRFVLVEERAKRFGVYGICNTCKGASYLYTESEARLGLQMWFIHPRKGSSRGLYLKNVKNEKELELVVNYLKKARDRNSERFGRI